MNNINLRTIGSIVLMVLVLAMVRMYFSSQEEIRKRELESKQQQERQEEFNRMGEEFNQKMKSLNLPDITKSTATTVSTQSFATKGTQSSIPMTLRIDLVDDFKNGNFSVYQSNGNPKSKGLKFRIKYPNSLEPKEGNRPNVVQKFENYKIEGWPGFLVIVKTTEKFSKEDIESTFFTEQGLRDIVGNEKFISCETKLKLDGERCSSFEFIQTKRSENTVVNQDLLIYFKSYNIIWENYYIQILFSASQANSDEQELRANFEKHKPAFQMIVNSFILTSKWEN